MSKGVLGSDIVDAMKSMKSIIDKDKKTGGFPTPPVDFVGVPTVRIRTKKKKTPVKDTPNVMENEMYSNITNTSKILPKGSSVPLGLSRTNMGMKKNISKNKMNKKKPPSESSMSSTSSRSSGSSMSSRSGSFSSGSGSSASGSRSSASGSRSSVSSGEYKMRRGLEKKKRRDELMQEKVEMITRIVNLSKNGFSTTKKWTMKDDIDEIRYECYRLQRESNTKKSIKMMRQVLVSVTTMIEMGNSYFNPFNLRLEGFSKNMMLSINDYDDCFDQLHHKYSGRSSMGPEMQIMFTFLSAAVFHHAGNAINKKEEPKPKASSSPMSSMMGMMGMLGGLGGSKGNPPSTRSPPETSYTPEAPKESTGEESDKPKRRKMKGPGMASIPTGILSSLAPPPSSVTSTVPSMTIPQTQF